MFTSKCGYFYLVNPNIHRNSCVCSCIDCMTLNVVILYVLLYAYLWFYACVNICFLAYFWKKQRKEKENKEKSAFQAHDFSM